MEQQILVLIEDEVCRRTQLKLNEILKEVAKLYEIPMERLVKDTAGLEPRFCKGVLCSGQRCLKKPKENGFCKFHSKKETPPSETPLWEVI